jgi:NADH:ubiquinone oxidoreductase subunit F (NADH-binding)
MGIPLREIMYEIGGGIPGGGQVQSGADRRPLRRLHPGRLF